MRRATWLGVAVVWAAACGGGDDASQPGALADTAAAADTSSMAGGAMAVQEATATLHDGTGAEVGVARFSAEDGGLRLHLEVHGLPAGTHGVHIHETGQCDASATPAFSTAGGHLNPGHMQHGLQNPSGPHAGDLPNLAVGADGTGTLDATAVREVPDPMSVLLDADGAALIVHANEDDQRTDSGPDGPGNSGARIACGVVSR